MMPKLLKLVYDSLIGKLSSKKCIIEAKVVSSLYGTGIKANRLFNVHRYIYCSHFIPFRYFHCFLQGFN